MMMIIMMINKRIITKYAETDRPNIALSNPDLMQAAPMIIRINSCLLQLINYND